MVVSPNTIVCLYIPALAFFAKGCVDKHKKWQLPTNIYSGRSRCLLYLHLKAWHSHSLVRANNFGCSP